MIYHALYDISLGQYIDRAMYRKNETLQKKPQNLADLLLWRVDKKRHISAAIFRKKKAQYSTMIVCNTFAQCCK